MADNKPLAVRPRDDWSRMSREAHVRFWESGRVKIPPATHLLSPSLGGTTVASVFAPMRRPTRHRRAGVLFEGGHPCAADSPWKWLDLPSSRRILCCRAHAPSTPEQPTGTRLNAPTGPATAKGTTATCSTGLSRLNRVARQLAVYASPWRSPDTTQDSLAAAGQALPRGIRTRRVLKRGFSHVAASHIILLSRACLAQSPFPVLTREIHDAIIPRITPVLFTVQLTDNKDGIVDSRNFTVEDVVAGDGEDGIHITPFLSCFRDSKLALHISGKHIWWPDGARTNQFYKFSFKLSPDELKKVEKAVCNLEALPNTNPKEPAVARSSKAP